VRRIYNEEIEGCSKGNVSIISGETKKNHELKEANDGTSDISNVGKNATN
jgi:hypothetical protein